MEMTKENMGGIIASILFLSIPIIIIILSIVYMNILLLLVSGVVILWQWYYIIKGLLNEYRENKQMKHFLKYGKFEKK